MKRPTADDIERKSAINRLARGRKPTAYLRYDGAAHIMQHVKANAPYVITACGKPTDVAVAVINQSVPRERMEAMVSAFKKHTRKTGSKGEEMLAFQLKLSGVTGWIREYKFHPVRKWKVDFAWVKEKLAVEVEGGSWNAGRHTRHAGFEADCIKYNELQLAGWRLLRFTTELVQSGHAVSKIQLALLP